MADFDAYLKAFAAAACLAFGLVVLAGGRKRAPLYLAVFLFLIAANQAVEAVRAMVVPADPTLWSRAATVFAALDPFFLYLFARETLPSSRAPRWDVAAMGAACAVMVALGFQMGSTVAYTRVASALLSTYTAVAYSLAAASFLRAFAHDPSDQRSRVFFLACALVAVRPWQELSEAYTLVYLDVILDASPTDPRFGFVALAGSMSWSVMLFVLGVCIALAAILPNRAITMPTALVGLALGYVVTAGLASASIVLIPSGGRYPDPEPAYWPGLIVLGRASAAVRWLVFGGFVTAAILRDDLLGMSLARRRLAARAFIALGMAGGVGLLFAASAIVFGPSSVQLRPLDWVLIGLVMVATQGFRPLIDRVASRVYGVPMPADRVGALEAYRRALHQAAAEGRDARHDPELARLAAELGITDADAALLARLTDEAVVSPLVAGQRVGGRYRVRRLIGRGGAGRVFLARDETLDRDVVLKEVLHDEPDDEAGLREARAAGGLQHPNVVVVHDVLRRPGSSLLVTEYVPGGSLAERVASHGMLPLDEGLRVLDGVLAGLEAVHARGLVHRDLKPANVLLTAEGAPKIADFGIARTRRGVTARFDEPDAFVGTPEFMAPEQRTGARATAATDVYAVGRLARLCIRGPLPPAIERAIARALADDPRDRYVSASQMRGVLAEAAGKQAAR